MQEELLVARRRLMEESDPTKKQATSDNTVQPMEVDASTPVDPYKNTTGQYELVAVLSHKGIYADGGHYVSWVKQAAGKLLGDDVL